ncbi:glycosyltransferase [Fulvivirgaceae bacterium BMA12]|uniref:Glycosyltransferase n=1 Tax=Agaribacillus aureus TaxID=3051825 RepID=A0ABT8L5E9_9BACT|nr:glycosyltransferase [Fulvivirgaceae bacterium BMA12]
MVITLWILVIIYCLLIAILIYGWKKVIPTPGPVPQVEKQVTVLIPVRNEAANIEYLLSDLENQQYPKAYFNVIVIDDHSEDETAELVNKYRLKSSYDLELLPLTLEKGFKGSRKKHAISQGVENTNAELIICTDGDCRVGNRWLRVMVDHFKRQQAYFISGPVMLQGDHKWWHGVQIMEFACLIGVGGASLKLGAPNMSNGANMGFHRETFKTLNGYRGFEHIHSGDDEFLMYKIFKKYPKAVHFLQDYKAVVKTGVQNSVSDFVNQRKRWAGKWKFHRQLGPKFLAFFIFIVNLVLVAALYWLLMGKATVTDIWPPILLKFLADFLFVYIVLKFFNKKVNLLDFLILEFLYPWYAVFFGLISNFGSYWWKGRKLNN